MSFENMPPEVSEHIQLFIKHFVNKNKQNRWKTMLSMKPEKWSKVSAYDCNQSESADWNTSLTDTIQKLGLQKYLKADAFVFQVGHGADIGWYKSTMQKALLGENAETECIISIIPGKLAISYGHSNEFRLCKK